MCFGGVLGNLEVFSRNSVDRRLVDHHVPCVQAPRHMGRGHYYVRYNTIGRPLAH